MGLLIHKPEGSFNPDGIILGMQNSYRLAQLETALAIALWAISFISIKIALDEVSPITLIILRYGMGWLILGTTTWLQGGFSQLRRNDLPRMFALGAVGVTLHQFLQVYGQASADASAAAFLASTAPAFMILMGAIFLRERLHFGQILGVLLATTGAGIVATGTPTPWAGGVDWSEPGNLLVLLSAVVWAVFSIMSRLIVQGRPPALITTGMMFFGWAISLPVFIIQRGWQEIPGLSLTGWGALLFTGILSTAASFLLYNHALKQAPASRLAAIQNIEPLIATVAAVLILNETVSLAFVIGGCAIIGGVFLAERQQPAPSKATRAV
jgi:drug/metabolite transporter (DMT)-like permease